MPQQPTVGIAILASGSSVRFGSNKLLADFRGRALIEHAFLAVPPELRHNTLVITCHDGVAELAQRHGIGTLPNPGASEGISAGIRLAAEAFQSFDGVLFLVGDQPLLRQASVRELVRVFSASPDSIVCAAKGSEPVNPSLFPSSLFPELLALHGDRGGKKVILAHPELVKAVPLAREELLDCDTPEAVTGLSEAQFEKQL